MPRQGWWSTFTPQAGNFTQWFRKHEVLITVKAIIFRWTAALISQDPDGLLKPDRSRKNSCP